MMRLKSRIAAASMAAAALAGGALAVSAPASAAPARHVTPACDILWTNHCNAVGPEGTTAPAQVYGSAGEAQWTFAGSAGRAAAYDLTWT